MNELALFNDLFDGFEDDGYLMPSFNFRKAFVSSKVDVKEEKDAYTENLSAKVTNGVLSVTMPRKALAAPKRIAITAA